MLTKPWGHFNADFRNTCIPKQLIRFHALEPTSRREFNAPSDVFAGVQRPTVIGGASDAIEPIKLFGEASPGRVRQSHFSGRSQRAIDEERSSCQKRKIAVLGTLNISILRSNLKRRSSLWIVQRVARVPIESRLATNCCDRIEERSRSMDSIVDAERGRRRSLLFYRGDQRLCGQGRRKPDPSVIRKPSLNVNSRAATFEKTAPSLNISSSTRKGATLVRPIFSPARR